MHRFQRFVICLFVLILAVPIQTRGVFAASGSIPAPIPAHPSVNQVDSVFSSDDETSFRVLATDYRLENVAGVDGPCQRIEMDGYELAGAAGTPHLPMRSLLLALPPGATPSVELVSDSAVQLPGTHRLCPAPEAVAETGEDDTVRYVEQAVAADADVYGQNALLPASPVGIVENGYAGRLQYVRLEIAPFQYNPFDGSLIHHSQMQVRVRHRALSLQAAATSEPDAFIQSVQSLFLNGERASGWASQPAAVINATATGGAVNNGWQPPAPSLRLFVEEEGLYAVTYDELAQAGVPVASIYSNELRLYLNGEDVAIRVVDSNNVDDVDGIFEPGDRLLFYGQGVDEKYTDANVYWLDYGASGITPMLTRDAKTDGQAVNSYQATVRYEENFNYVSSAPKLSGYNHWYGRLATVAGGNAAKSWTIPVNTSVLATGIQTATLEAAMVSRTRGTHHVNFYVNDTYVGDGQWSGPAYRAFTLDFDQALLTAGRNVFRVEIANDLNGQTVSVVYFDWLKVHYQRKTSAVDDRLILDVPEAGAWDFSVDGFSGGALEAYDVTDPLAVAHIPVTGSKTAVFGATATEASRYLVQRINQRKSVAAIERANTADLLDTDNQADYFVITHKDFLSAIQPLAEYRAARGLKVAVIDAQHIYDTFNYGRMSSQAIRDFLAYAYANWKTSGSSYVLLVGDGTFDPRNYRSDSARTFIPPYLEMVDPDLGETAADNRYVTIVGTDRMPDMHLGRLPAESPSDVTAMVKKIIDYESAPADSGWNGHVLFVSDDLKGGGGAFYNYSDVIADGTQLIEGEEVALLPENYQKTKLYLPFDCANGDDCRAKIVSNINQGALLISYVGHSAKEYWAEENLLNLDALDQLNNAAYPVMLPMTCLEGYYHEAETGRMSLAEALVRKPNGGSIASWSSSGLGLASGHDYL